MIRVCLRMIWYINNYISFKIEAYLYLFSQNIEKLSPFVQRQNSNEWSGEWVISEHSLSFTHHSNLIEHDLIINITPFWCIIHSLIQIILKSPGRSLRWLETNHHGVLGIHWRSRELMHTYLEVNDTLDQEVICTVVRMESWVFVYSHLCCRRWHFHYFSYIIYMVK